MKKADVCTIVSYLFGRNYQDNEDYQLRAVLLVSPRHILNVYLCCSLARYFAKNVFR
jgi:hypothetical protein